jgi:hypothetical protein
MASLPSTYQSPQNIICANPLIEIGWEVQFGFKYT